MKDISAILPIMFSMAAYAQTEITSIPVDVSSIGVEYPPVVGPIIPVGMIGEFEPYNKVNPRNRY